MADATPVLLSCGVSALHGTQNYWGSASHCLESHGGLGVIVNREHGQRVKAAAQTLGRGGATLWKSMLSAPLGRSPRRLQCPTRSVGRRCPGHSWPQPRKGRKRSFSNTSASTTPAPETLCSLLCGCAGRESRDSCSGMRESEPRAGGGKACGQAWCQPIPLSSADC